jgi:orotate phosphoribosyltransferase
MRNDLLVILAREAYVERKVTLSSGKKSNFYLDCRKAIFLPRASFLVGELMLALVLEAGVVQVGGMAVAAVPVTDAIVAAAYRNGADIRGFFVRKEAKSHGMQQQIEGAFRRGVATAIVEDTVTTGGSSVAAIDAARAAGAIVTHAFALVDRGEGGADAFARAGVKYSFICTPDDIRAERAKSAT